MDPLREILPEALDRVSQGEIGDIEIGMIDHAVEVLVHRGTAGRDDHQEPMLLAGAVGVLGRDEITEFRQAPRAVRMARRTEGGPGNPSSHYLEEYIECSYYGRELFNQAFRRSYFS